MDAPKWFAQLQWSQPVHVADLNLDRDVIPDFPGCYVFTIGPVPVAPGRVLYVGEAAGQGLRGRIPTYLVDFRKAASVTPGGSKRRGHKGKGFILEARHVHGDQGVYCRWVQYGADPAGVHVLEASLIQYLNPSANDRDEEARHSVLGDWEGLDPRLIL